MGSHADTAISGLERCIRLVASFPCIACPSTQPIAPVKPYLVSLAVGVLVGGIYALLRVRSPAPPVIALVGLLGMLIGEQGVGLGRAMLAPGEASAAQVPATIEPSTDQPGKNHAP